VKWNVSSTGGGFSTVTISAMKPEDVVYAEENTLFTSSGVFDEKGNPDGKLRRSLITPEELAGASYTPQKRFTFWGQMAEESRIDEAQTAARKNSGERPYVVYRATAKNQSVTFKSHFPGSILIWQVREMAENFDTKVSYAAPNPEDRPRGTLIAVKGAFLCGDLRARSTVFNTKQDDIRQFSGTGDAFQRFAGKGVICLEAHGTLQEVRLKRNQTVTCWPGDLLAFTEGITLRMISAGDSTLRNEENNDYLILAKAGEKGGFLYAKSVQVGEFFRKQGSH